MLTDGLEVGVCRDVTDGLVGAAPCVLLQGFDWMNQILALL